MNRDKFKQRLEQEILILDGGYGTEYFKMGYGNVPGEILNIKHPEVVEALQRNYVKSGADIILTNTFNANPAKLALLGYKDLFEKINLEAVKISKRAANGKVLVFGNISSTGKFPQPLGSQNFEDAVESFRKQAEILLEAGVDGFIVETFSDIKELKAVVWGIREVTEELPLIVQMTFESNARTITGTSARIFATVFDDLDVDVIGINCSTGPEEMLDVFREVAENTSKFLSVEPNAGNPYYDGNSLFYKTSPEEFAIHVEDFINLGANIIGGCCGTGPDHIKLVHRFAKKYKPKPRNKTVKQTLSSRTIIKDVTPFTIIGERINPASRKKFQQQIIDGDFSTVLQEAEAQKHEGATVLDINLGIEKMLDFSHFQDVIRKLDKQSSLPLSMDIQTNKYLEQCLREYPGRPLINSARITPKSLERKSKLLKKYGGMLILLAMGKQIPETVDERVQLILEGIKVLEENGISRDRVFADALVLSLGANNDPEITRRTIRQLSKLGIKTVIGLSNLSFGLPDRSYLNGAFIAQCVNSGLNAAIMNSGDNFVMDNLHGSLKLKGQELCPSSKLEIDDPILKLMFTGETQILKQEIEKMLSDHTPIEISQNILGKAMEKVGNLYAKGKIYLPQLLMVNDTTQPVFDYLNSLTSESKRYKAKVVIATVEGDIHDIGKKIVGTVLKSGGFEVIDIGTDISAKKIIEAVKEYNADILGLSAMMTTTIDRIEEIAGLIKKEGIKVILVAGGASMNENLAVKFGCNGYCPNAINVVEMCEKLLRK
ncbi:MAG: homocysteine S-methyltransferase family protein [Candidatus Cloacimonetes bacterium]|nr:homocysteine S-methyltransferase family protein [Candidatus Cloacimonadota bacterium]